MDKDKKNKKPFVERILDDYVEGEYDDEGFFNTPNGSFWDPDGVYFNREGFDKHGYNNMGFDVDGFDQNGISINGINKKTHEEDERITFVKAFIESGETIPQFAKSKNISKIFLNVNVLAKKGFC